MEITRTSTLTGIDHTMDLPVTQEQLHSWQSGTLIQLAMPNLTPSQREFLISGVTEEEWNNEFPEFQDDDDFDEERESAMYDLNGNPR